MVRRTRRKRPERGSTLAVDRNEYSTQLHCPSELSRLGTRLGFNVRLRASLNKLQVASARWLPNFYHEKAAIRILQLISYPLSAIYKILAVLTGLKADV